MKFEDLPLREPLLRGLQAAGYEAATPIQARAIPQLLKGRDLVGCAQTGTGKTAAFAVPTLQRLLETPDAPTGAQRRRRRSGRRPIRALVLSPTRELAGQICESMATYGKFTGLRSAVIYGGVRQGPQVKALQAGVDVLVATPGRLLDLIGQGYVDLAEVEVLILDEADQMLDMGFIHDLRKIVAKVPVRRQTLMFSATMPPEIRRLAGQWLRRPFEVHVAPVASTPERVEQAVYFVERRHKAAALTNFLTETTRAKTLVFSRTKRGADKLARILQRDGVKAAAIHGDKSQSRRQAVIREFNSTRPPVLVATDLAARGLDFSDVSHVVNYDLPEVPETYVHRIGRTARAGASGRAVSFCDNEERKLLRMIEQLTGRTIAVQQLPGLPAVDADADRDGAARVSTRRKSRRPNTSSQPRTSGQNASGQSPSGGRKPRRAKRNARSGASATRGGASKSTARAKSRGCKPGAGRKKSKPGAAGGR